LLYNDDSPAPDSTRRWSRCQASEPDLTQKSICTGSLVTFISRSLMMMVTIWGKGKGWPQPGSAAYSRFARTGSTNCHNLFTPENKVSEEFANE